MRRHLCPLRRLCVEALETRSVPSSVPVAPLVLGSLIDGLVGNASTHVGVAGVRVQLLDSHARVIRLTQTDSLGQYSFASVQPGYYVAREPGQVATRTEFTFLNGTPVDVGDVDLDTGGAYPPMTVGYETNHTELTADAPGPILLPPHPDRPPIESPAYGYFAEREDQIKRFFQPNPLGGFNRASQISNAAYLALKGTVALFHLI